MTASKSTSKSRLKNRPEPPARTREDLVRELAQTRRKIETLEAAHARAGAAENALRESEKRFRTLSEATDAMVFMIRGTRYFYINPAAEKVTGYSLEELQSMNHWDLAHPDYKEIIRKRGEDRQQGKKVVSWYEYKIVTKSGEERWLDVAASYIEYDGQPAVIGTAFDVTDRKRAEEQIKSQERQLIQADKMATLGILVSGVAHEINNPLNFILLNARIAAKAWNEITPILEDYMESKGDFALAGMPYSKARERIGELISGISEGAARIEKIVTGLRNFSRRDQGDLKEAVDINSVAESALLIVNDLVRKSTTRFSAAYGKKLPPVLGNHQQLEQVVINLITNACQALPDKERAVFLSTAWDPRGKRVRVVIADEGQGIPPDDMKHVLDPFFTTKRNSGGTGLGLSISYNIVRNHGGDLRLASEPGKGTTGESTLPADNRRAKETAR